MSMITCNAKECRSMTAQWMSQRWIRDFLLWHFSFAFLSVSTFGPFYCIDSLIAMPVDRYKADLKRFYSKLPFLELYFLRCIGYTMIWCSVVPYKITFRLCYGCLYVSKLIWMEDHHKKLSLSIGRYIESCIHALVKRYFVALKLNWPPLMKTAAL